VEKEEFFSRCDRFNGLLEKSKRNITAVESLGPELIGPIEQELKATPEVECREGCSYCCHLRIEAISFELVAIYLFIQRTKTRKQLEEIRQKIDSQYIHVRGLSIEEHFKKNIKCPLLDNDKCSIYPVRPFSCAGHHSCSVDNCKNSYNNPEITGTEGGGIPTAMNIKEVQSIQFAVAKRVITAKKHDESHYELISGLYHVFHNPASIQRWKVGRKLIKS
jgi:Fe-S-cluster containining protein